METGDAGGLAPGPDDRQRPRARRRGAPGHKASRAGHGLGPRPPRLHREGTNAVESASARRRGGPARTAGLSPARPGDAVNGVFRAEALYLPGRPEFWAVFFGRRRRRRRGWRWQREWRRLGRQHSGSTNLGSRK